MTYDTYGHTPLDKATNGDVYGINFDEARAARRPLRLGLIGAGGVAQSKYFPAVARLRMIWEPIEIVAFAEPRTDHAAKIQRIYGGAPYTDCQTMIDTEALDGVIVTGPDALHIEAVRACLVRGLHVLVEKPITRSLQDAQMLCDGAHLRDLVLMSVANKRYSPPYRRAKQFIENGPLANPALFSAKFTLGYDYVDLFESGTIHLFDLTRFFMGEVRRVSAIGTNRYGRNRRKYPVDNAIISFEFISGAVGSLLTSSSALNLKPWERVEIYGDHAWLSVEDQLRLTLYDSEEGGAQTWEPCIPNTLLFDEEFGGFMGILENFAQAIRGNEKPLVTGWDGYRAYELLVAAQLSLARRAPVDLPLDLSTADAEARGWLLREGWPGKDSQGK